MTKYEDFTISMEPASIAMLADLLDKHTPRGQGVASAELLNLAAELFARMQNLAQEKPKQNEDWLS